MEFRDLYEIERLDTAYWNCADCISDQNIDELFHSEGILLLGTLKLVGKKEIKEFFDKRASHNLKEGRFTRHIVSNISHEYVVENQVKSYSKVMVFSGYGEDLPIQVSLPSTIADVEDTYVKDSSDKWKFAMRRICPVFIGDGAPKFAQKEN